MSIVEKTNKTDMSLLRINKEESEVTNYNYQQRKREHIITYPNNNTLWGGDLSHEKKLNLK